MEILASEGPTDPSGEMVPGAGRRQRTATVLGKLLLAPWRPLLILGRADENWQTTARAATTKRLLPLTKKNRMDRLVDEVSWSWIGDGNVRIHVRGSTEASQQLPAKTTGASEAQGPRNHPMFHTTCLGSRLMETGRCANRTGIFPTAISWSYVLGGGRRRCQPAALRRAQNWTPPENVDLVFVTLHETIPGNGRLWLEYSENTANPWRAPRR